jgi:hypothetical protein
MRNHRSVYSSAFIPMLTGALAGSMAMCMHAQEVAKITYDDHIKPIFREHCASCHNNNAKKGGLSLESYQATMAGGSSGEVLVAGDLDASRLYALTAHKEQPTMPPMQDKIAQAKWNKECLRTAVLRFANRWQMRRPSAWLQQVVQRVHRQCLHRF